MRTESTLPPRTQRKNTRYSRHCFSQSLAVVLLSSLHVSRINAFCVDRPVTSKTARINLNEFNDPLRGRSVGSTKRGVGKFQNDFDGVVIGFRDDNELDKEGYEMAQEFRQFLENRKEQKLECSDNAVPANHQFVALSSTRKILSRAIAAADAKQDFMSQSSTQKGQSSTTQNSWATSLFSQGNDYENDQSAGLFSGHGWSVYSEPNVPPPSHLNDNNDQVVENRLDTFITGFFQNLFGFSDTTSLHETQWLGIQAAITFGMMILYLAMGLTGAGGPPPVTATAAESLLATTNDLSSQVANVLEQVHQQSTISVLSNTVVDSTNVSL